MSKIKNIILYGTGGFAREVFHYIKQSEKYQKIKFKGFLDSNKSLLENKDLASFYMGGEDNYKFNIDDYFMIPIADVNIRYSVYNKFKKKNANFFTYIHDSVILNNKVIFGEGNIVCPNSVFTDDIKIGDFNIFNINVTVGHDVKIDSFNTFNSHCDITGGSLVKNKNFFGSRVSLLPKCKIGNNNKIAAGSVVYKGVGDNLIYLGNPAKNIGENE